jgi:hypothetical protein
MALTLGCGEWSRDCLAMTGALKLPVASPDLGSLAPSANVIAIREVLNARWLKPGFKRDARPRCLPNQVRLLVHLAQHLLAIMLLKIIGSAG